MRFFNMKEWILSIGTIIILTTIADLILPDGKIGKYIKCFFSLLVMLVILTPIINYKKNNLNIDMTAIDKEYELQNNYLNFIYQKRIDECKKSIIEIFKQNSIDNLCENNILIEYKIENNGEFIYENISIDLKNNVIIFNDEHIIIIEKIKEEIKLLVKNSCEVVILYE